MTLGHINYGVAILNIKLHQNDKNILISNKFTTMCLTCLIIHVKYIL